MRRNTRNTLTIGLAVATLVATGCGGDDDASDDSDDAASEESSEQQTGDAPVPEPGDDGDEAADTGDGGDAAAPAGGGQGTATLELANGESFEFSILCMLEPQESAGSEILFTAVSYDDPGLDVTQFGDEGTVTGTAVISVYDGSYNTLWEASTFNEAFGGELELGLDGSTIRGSGTFYSEGDPIEGEPVDGELEANC